MAQKYRVKLKSSRVVGPFRKEQIGELYIKGHISGQEECQLFPAGDWKSLKDFKELSDLILQIIQKEVTLEDLVEQRHSSTLLKINPKNLKKKEKTQTEKPDQKNKATNENQQFSEFQFSKKDELEVDYDELEKNYKAKEEKEKKKKEEEAKKLEATRIIQKPNLNEDIDKTLIVNPPAEIKEQTDEPAGSDDKEQSETKEDEQQKNNEEVPEFNFEENTEFVDINEFLPDLKGVSSVAEKDFEKKMKEEMGEDTSDDESEQDDEEEEVEEESANKKKKMKPIVALAFIVVIFFLLEDSTPEPRDPRSMNIRFPVVSEVVNESQARMAYQKGLEYYQKGDYISKLLASNEFYNSLGHQFQDNPSLGKLILTYAELFDNASNERQGASNLFRLIKIAQSKILTDDNVAAGSAIFYMNNGKYQTAVNTIENYLRVSSGTSRIFAVYLESLIKVGNMSRAGDVAKRLYDIPNKSVYVYHALNEFEKVNQNFSKAEDVINEALEHDRHDVSLLLELAQFQIRRGDKERLQLIIELIDQLDAERSPVYFAKFLEINGVLKAMEGDNEQAANLFRAALAINETDDLRSKLAALALGGDEAVEALIIESRVVDLMKRAERSMERREWEDAFVYAIEATDRLPTHIGARVLLSQIERGFYEQAISSLRKLKADYPLNLSVNYHFGIALIEANMLNQANNHIALIDQRLHDTAEFNELLARYYQRDGDINTAVRWYNESIKRDPLNDRNYFALAQIFTKNRNFDRARNKLLEAIMLNPSNVYYRSAYAEILYDLNGASTAIGYLNEALESNPDHPKLIGDIAIFYYRNGQMRDYERYREKLEELNSDEPSFYEFKIRRAQMTDNKQEVVKYAHELIRVDPGDIDTRLMLSEFLIKLERYDEAERVIEGILERLSTYPKAHYLLADIYFKRQDYAQAQEYAKIEVESNPDLKEGYFIKGRIAEANGDHRRAVELYERALSLDVNYVEAIMGLANINHQRNRLSQARELYRRAQRHDQNNPRIWRQLGFVHRSAGELQAAAEAFDTYLRLDPGASDKSQIERIMENLR